jgi:peptide/nickel transport system permease protein
VTVLVGLGTVILTAVLSGLIGIVSGYFGGTVDMVVQRFVDIWQSFPAIFLLLTLVTILGTAGDGFFGLGRGPDVGPDPQGGDWIWHAIPRTSVIVLALGLILAGGASRVIRSAVLSVKANPYIEAARTVGAGDWRIIMRHILPNVFPVIIILSSLQLGVAVLAEATISFLGLGIPPPFPTWGQMLGGQARLLGVKHPYLVLVPGLAIFIAVYAFNMLGDALRDVLDPRLRGSR